MNNFDLKKYLSEGILLKENFENSDLVKRANNIKNYKFGKLVTSQDLLVKSYRETTDVMKSLASAYKTAKNSGDTETVDIILPLLKDLTPIKKKLEKYMGMITKKFDPAQGGPDDEKFSDGASAPDISDFDLS